jgi:hypothetical protein
MLTVRRQWSNPEVRSTSLRGVRPRPAKALAHPETIGMAEATTERR